MEELAYDDSVAMIVDTIEENVEQPVEIIAEEEDRVCAVCLDGEVYDNNEILYCDICDVPVHQSCYGVERIPAGSWYCDPCSLAMDPKQLACELCSNTGGAYKQVDKSGKWVHSLCYIWIPEIYTVEVKKGVSMIALNSLDKKRFKLKCGLCSTKGACIQCNFGRCTSAAHPWCIFHKPQGYTRRVCKDEDGDLVYEVFCKPHASAVTEPLKHRPKSKSATTVPIETVDEDMDVALRNKLALSSSNSSSRKYLKPGNQLSMTHSLRFLLSNSTDNQSLSRKQSSRSLDADEDEEFVDPKHFEPKSKGPRKPDRRRRQKSVSIDSDEDEEMYLDDDDEDDRLQSTLDDSSLSQVYHEREGNSEEELTFPILHLCEWPGQAEGEAMDLDHFWNATSMIYADDHCPEWVSFMTRKLPVSPDAYSTDPEINPFLCQPCSIRDNCGINEVTAAALEEKLAVLGTDKERLTLFDFEKRHLLLQSLRRRCNELSQAVARHEAEGASYAAEILSAQHRAAQHSFEARLIPNTPYCGPQHPSSDFVFPCASSELPDQRWRVKPYESKAIILGQGGNIGLIAEDDLLTIPPLTTDSSQEIVEKVPDNGLSTLRVVFDSEHQRLGCTFSVPVAGLSTVKIDSDEKCTEANINDGTSTLENGITAMRLPSAYDKFCEYAENTALIRDPMVQNQNRPVHFDSKALAETMTLESVQKISNADSLAILDRMIVAKDEDDLFARMIRSDQAVYVSLMQNLTARIWQLMSCCDFAKLADYHTAVRTNWAKVENIYSKQRVWKRVATSLCKGIREQRSPDANRVVLEAIPASWTISVDGRPPPVPDDEEEDPDSVCMVCFDGTSNDANRILFCDGCNAPLHQCCYGVSEIPEGDFYCERCLAIQATAADIGYMDAWQVKEEIKCCLCPLHHGGLKPTKDGRWVHLSCAIWTQRAVIADLNEMSPVDISQVAVQIPLESTDLSSRGRRLKSQDDGLNAEEIFKAHNIPVSDISAPCIVCGVHGGYLTRCCGSAMCDETSVPCTNVFHPICAWFRGLYFESHLDDPSFQGRDREGVFPSGVRFCTYCPEHTPADGATEESRNLQVMLRSKQRINEADLEVVPGRGGKKKRKPKRSPPAASAQSSGSGSQQQRSAGGSNVPKDLNPDVYSESMCAYCMVPIDDIVKVEVKTENVSESVVPLSDDSVTQDGDVQVKATVHDPVVEMVDTSTENVNLEVPPALPSCAAPSPISRLTCILCKVSVHPTCSASLGEIVAVGSSDWMCTPCSLNMSDIRCTLCPRRNGGFKPTTENTWTHVFCARNCPGQIKISTIGEVEIRHIPKEAKKQKCFVCNRKHGACLRCSSLGCNNYFHPLCGERSGKAFISTRLGEMQAFCSDHIPEGVEKLPSGYWVDPVEVQRFRYTLDRARIVLDTICRREKLKRILCKTDGELFSLRFNRMLDKAKGRKSSISGAMDIAEIFEDDDDDYVSDAEDDLPYEGDASFSPELKGKGGRPSIVRTPQPDITVKTNWLEPEEVLISGSWTKNGEVRIPKKIVHSIGGVTISKYDAGLSLSKKEYVRIQQSKVQKLFSQFSNVERLEFGQSLPGQIIKHMRMDDKTFFSEMVKLDQKLGGKLRLRMPDTTPVKSHSNGCTKAPNSSKREVKIKKTQRTEVEEHVPEDASSVIQTPKPSSRANSSVSSSTTSSKKRSRQPTVLDGNQDVDSQSGHAGEFTDTGKVMAGSAITSSESLPSHTNHNRKTNSTHEYLLQQKMFHHRTFPAPTSQPRAQSLQEYLVRFDRNLCLEVAANRVDEYRAAGFGLVLQRSGLFDALGAAEIGAEDWQCQSGKDLVALERILMDVLNEIMDLKVPIEPSATAAVAAKPTGKKDRKEKSTKKDTADSDADRYLADDFFELPDRDAAPDYDSFVRRRISLTIIKERLTNHCYRSIAMFAKDFTEMLNNGKAFSGEMSQTSQDANALAVAFRNALFGAYTTPLKISAAQTGALKVSRASSRVASSTYPSQDCQFNCCQNCQHVYTKSGWPDELYSNLMEMEKSLRTSGHGSSSSSSAKKARKSKVDSDLGFGWFCPDCVEYLKSELIGLYVLVWWADDKALYGGKIDAYDFNSSRHRVVYDDGEWEFLNLIAEPVVMSKKL